MKIKKEMEIEGKDIGRKQPTYKGLELTKCIHCGHLSFSMGECPRCGKWKSGEKKVE